MLLENLISEKATMLASQNKYVFKVDKYAGKFQIKEAVEGYYGVQVVSVNTIKISPKKRIQGRTIGWKKGFKKAVVTLRQGIRSQSWKEFNHKRKLCQSRYTKEPVPDAETVQ